MFTLPCNKDSSRKQLRPMQDAADVPGKEVAGKLDAAGVEVAMARGR